jgi:hypothetical protein
MLGVGADAAPKNATQVCHIQRRPDDNGLGGDHGSSASREETIHG